MAKSNEGDQVVYIDDGGIWIGGLTVREIKILDNEVILYRLSCKSFWASAMDGRWKPSQDLTLRENLPEHWSSGGYDVPQEDQWWEGN